MAANMEQPRIETFVIFKTETTDCPWEGGLRSKAVEICCIAVPREYLEKDATTDETEKFYSMINPERRMGDEASQATGLSFEIFDQNIPNFRELFGAFEEFILGLPKPVCLVAHNGNAFDFRQLRFECNEIDKDLPEDLLTADSRWAFQNMLKDSPDKTKYNLPALFKRFTGEDRDPKRAEEKADMLLEIINMNKAFFLQWAQEKCKNITKIKPFYYDRKLDGAEDIEKAVRFITEWD